MVVAKVAPKAARVVGDDDVVAHDLTHRLECDLEDPVLDECGHPSVEGHVGLHERRDVGVRTVGAIPILEVGEHRRQSGVRVRVAGGPAGEQRFGKDPGL